jgi:hypothetical protein
MVKETKYLRKQADKAERAALATGDAETSKGLRAMASAYRTQADILKSKKKRTKSRR